MPDTPFDAKITDEEVEMAVLFSAVHKATLSKGQKITVFEERTKFALITLVKGGNPLTGTIDRGTYEPLK